jgi:hypothetical protein
VLEHTRPNSRDESDAWDAPKTRASPKNVGAPKRLFDDLLEIVEKSTLAGSENDQLG